MSAYIIRRILISIPMLLLMSFITFCAITLPQGDVLAEYRNDPSVSDEFIAGMERQYGLNQPVYLRYFYWLRNIFLEWPDHEAEKARQATAELTDIFATTIPDDWNTPEPDSYMRVLGRISNRVINEAQKPIEELKPPAEPAEDEQPADSEDAEPGDQTESGDADAAEDAETRAGPDADSEVAVNAEVAEQAEAEPVADTDAATEDGGQATHIVLTAAEPSPLHKAIESRIERAIPVSWTEGISADARNSVITNLANRSTAWYEEMSQRGDTRSLGERFRGYLPVRVRLDLGYSFIHRVPVTSVLASRLLNTLMLSLVSLVLVWGIAVPVGTYCAVNQYSLGDKVLSFISFIGMSFPGFFLALILLYLASLTGLLPIGGLTSPNHAALSFTQKITDVASHMVVPMLVIVTGALAGMQRLMRGNMLEVLRQQYVTTARAKGLHERDVIYNHALRNAVNPMITIFGYQMSGLLSGAALTEIITSYPGMGSLMLEAVQARDVFLVMSSMLMGGVLLIAGNLVADILLSIADPRISYD